VEFDLKKRRRLFVHKEKTGCIRWSSESHRPGDRHHKRKTVLDVPLAADVRLKHEGLIHGVHFVPGLPPSRRSPGPGSASAERRLALALRILAVSKPPLGLVSAIFVSAPEQKSSGEYLLGGLKRGLCESPVIFEVNIEWRHSRPRRAMYLPNKFLYVAVGELRSRQTVRFWCYRVWVSVQLIPAGAACAKGGRGQTRSKQESETSVLLFARFGASRGQGLRRQ